MLIKYDGKVGIGTTAPAAKTHISNGSSGVTPDSTADELFVEDDSTSGITIGTPNGSAGKLAFGDPEDADVGAISYSHVLNKLMFTVDASYRASCSAMAE